MPREDDLQKIRRAARVFLYVREVSPTASFFGTFSFLPVSGFSILLVALLFFVARPMPVHAQVSSGSILGYVYDPSGALIANATVIVTDANRATLRKTVTDSSGAFSVAELSPGVYSVTASSVGFGEITQSDVHVLVNTETRSDFHLPIAGQKKTVQVTVLSPEAQPETSEVGTVIDQQEIDSIPLNRRNFLELALLSPGVAPPVQNSELSSFGAFSMNADGGREESNDFLLDGVDNNDPYVNRYGVEPPMDSIQEFKVATNSYDAEYGRNSAAQVNVITRQGTNDFHGSTYDYLRNRVLDARNYFDPTDTAKLVRNQFGFSVGGPVVHNNTFFFASTDWFRDREGLSQVSTVPTGDEAGGNLAALCQSGFDVNGLCKPPTQPGESAVQIYNPANGQPFQNNLIPSGDITSVAKNILKMFPSPNLAPAPGNLYGTSDSSPVQNENDAFGTYRVDHRFGDSDSLNGRYSFTTVNLFEPWGGSSNGLASANVGPGFGDYVKDDVQDVMLQYRRVMSNRAVNTVSASYGRFSRDVLPQNFKVNVGQLWDVPWLNVPSTGYGFPSISVAGLSGVGDNTTYPIYRHTNTYQIEDQLAVDRGPHQLKIGGEVRELQLNGSLSLFTRGSLSFSGAATGNALADLLLGYPTFGLHSQGAVSINMRSQAYAAYIQDDWRISRNLTLNLGLRYEFMRPPISPDNQMYTLDSADNLVRVGTNGIPQSGVRSDHDDFAPRVGFAWNVGRSFVVRAGYGVYYDTGMFEVDSSMFFNPPEFDLLAYFGTPLSNPFQSGFAIPPQLAVVNTNVTTPYVQQWNLSVERPLGSLGTLSVGYVGSKGTHLIETYDLNQPTLVTDPAFCVLNPTQGDCPVSARTPHPNYGGIYYINTVADSNYNSFQATFNRPLGSRMSLWAAYTWSHSIDDQSAFSDTIADPNFPQNSNDLAAERGNSSFDMRQRLVLTYVLRLPNENRWTRDTEFHGITSIQSGEWFTPTLAFNNSQTDNSAPGQEVGSDRPNLIGNPNSGTCSNGHPVRTADCWFNTSAFAVASPYTFGDAGRNSLVGPGLATFDLSLMRRFALSERFRLTAEAEAFNLFNRANFKLPQAVAPSGLPGAPLSVSPLFGEIPSANPARQIQVALRLSF